jgi:hypothetical protein
MNQISPMADFLDHMEEFMCGGRGLFPASYLTNSVVYPGEQQLNRNIHVTIYLGTCLPVRRDIMGRIRG